MRPNAGFLLYAELRCYRCHAGVAGRLVGRDVPVRAMAAAARAEGWTNVGGRGFGLCPACQSKGRTHGRPRPAAA